MNNSDFIDVNVPDGTSGNWRVDTFTITEEKSVSSLLKVAFQGVNAFIPQGSYKRLSCGDETVMTNTPMEVRTNQEFIDVASGHVLINGLGLGMILNKLIEKDSVTKITVIENSPDVIALVAPSYASSDKVSIYLADAFNYQPPASVKYDAVWHDLWFYISAENLTSMRKLFKKYSGIASWQGAWCYKECLQKWNEDRKVDNLKRRCIDRKDVMRIHCKLGG